MNGRGWALTRAMALAVVVAFLSPVSPMVLVGLPLAVFLLAYRSRSFGTLFLALVILAFAFSVAPPSPSPVWYGERAWALMLAGGFVLAGLFIRSDRVTARSIVALGTACGAVAIAGVFRADTLNELDWLIGGQIRGAAQLAYQWLEAGGGGWASIAAKTLSFYQQVVDQRGTKK